MSDPVPGLVHIDTTLAKLPERHLQIPDLLDNTMPSKGKAKKMSLGEFMGGAPTALSNLPTGPKQRGYAFKDLYHIPDTLLF